MPVRGAKHEPAACLTERTAGVDWFRFRVDRLSEVRPTLAHVLEIQAEDEARAGKRRPWKFNGYEGHMTESIRYGLRGGKLLWETSGEAAPYTWTRMPLSGGVATRIDLQQTLRLSHALPGFGMRFLPLEATTHRLRLRCRRKVGLSRSSDGLWCGTVGRRTAHSYLRFYDKGVEKKRAAPGVLWRVELEAKYQHAEALCSQAVERMKDPDWCASYCEQQWKSAGCLWPITESNGAFAHVRIPPRAPAPASKLAVWLTHTVRPVIPRLLRVYTVREVLEMLGMEDVAAPREVSRERRRAMEGDAA